MPGIFMGPHMAVVPSSPKEGIVGPHMPVVPKRPKEGPTIQFEGGAGWIKGWGELPVVFKSLHHFLRYYESCEGRYSSAYTYSLNGVPTSTAICVASFVGYPWWFVLYMAPSHAESFPHYFMSHFYMSPWLGTGPAITAEYAKDLGVRYVGIYTAYVHYSASPLITLGLSDSAFKRLTQIS